MAWIWWYVLGFVIGCVLTGVLAFKKFNKDSAGTLWIDGSELYLQIENVQKLENPYVKLWVKQKANNPRE